MSQQSPVRRQTGRAPTRKSFAEQSAGDLLRSMLLLLLIVGVVLGVRGLITEDQERGVQAVDYSSRLTSAREQADYPVLAPRGLSRGWVATSASMESSGGTVRWHLGFLTPQREYVGLEQADFEPEDVAGKYVGDLTQGGTIAIRGEPWRLYSGETDTALVRRQGEVITVVVGTATAEVLTAFARSLSPG